jgi:hypothetical protein
MSQAFDAILVTADNSAHRWRMLRFAQPAYSSKDLKI